MGRSKERISGIECDILIHKKVKKSLRDAPRGIFNKFNSTVETLKANPIPWKGCDVKKIEGEENTYRIRIGNYRIIYSLEEEDKKICKYLVF